MKTEEFRLSVGAHRPSSVDNSKRLNGCSISMQPNCAKPDDGKQIRKRNTQDSNASESTLLAMVVRKSGMARLVES